MIPKCKIETLGCTMENTDGLSVEVLRPENDVGYAIVSVPDNQTSKYINVFDQFNTLDISFKMNTDTYTKVFSGPIADVKPKKGIDGQYLEVTAWDWGIALKKTLCNSSYGVESDNPTLEAIQEIIQHLVTNYVNLSLAGATTNWGLDSTDVENVLAAFDITSLISPYHDNFTLVNRLCDLGTAYAVANATVGPHWYVDTDKHLRMKLINASSTDGLWTRYYGSTQATATLEVDKDFILYDFQKSTEEYANYIILSSAFRKPAVDIWCEDGGPAWGNASAATPPVTMWSYSNTQYKVGSHSLKLHDTDGAGGDIYYPSTHDAAWDFTRCGTHDDIPHLNFYVYATSTDFYDNVVELATDHPAWGGANDYFYFQWNQLITPQANKWFYISLPVGPYWGVDPSIADTGWEWLDGVGGGQTWSEINGIEFEVEPNVGVSAYIDDLHLSGKIIREAIDTSEITATKRARQYFMRLDSAVDDTLFAADDSGTAARLVKAELFKRSQQPYIGKIEIPGAETLLPGQTLHIHACKTSDGTFRTDSDMRAKEVRHRWLNNGLRTEVNLTSDVTNSHAFAVPSAYTVLKEYAMALGHAEAKDLKASGVDRMLPRLSVNY